jgi:antitoxin CcdA
MKLSERNAKPYRSAKPNRKRPVNLTLSDDLLARAREMGLNISEIAEAALRMAVRSKDGERWLAENAEAIRLYDKWVEKRGVFGDRQRLF